MIRALYDNHLVKPSERAAVESEPEIAVLAATFDAKAGEEATLAGVLARYVVLTRHEPHCRNVDLVASMTQAGRFLVVEKWDSPDAVQAHLDGALMVDMAREALPALAAPPTLDLYDVISAHDLH